MSFPETQPPVSVRSFPFLSFPYWPETWKAAWAVGCVVFLETAQPSLGKVSGDLNPPVSRLPRVLHPYYPAISRPLHPYVLALLIQNPDQAKLMLAARVTKRPPSAFFFFPRKAHLRLSALLTESFAFSVTFIVSPFICPFPSSR